MKAILLKLVALVILGTLITLVMDSKRGLRRGLPLKSSLERYVSATYFSRLILCKSGLIFPLYLT